MKIHEYQAKQLFRKHGIPVPQGAVASTTTAACGIAEDLADFPVVLKAQVHAGGRGKGGGIKKAYSLPEVKKFANELLGMVLVTAQTGSVGRSVKKILVEQTIDIDRELYISLMSDRGTARIIIIACASGGKDIEEVASTTPEKIIRIAINPLVGLNEQDCLAVVHGLCVAPETIRLLTSLVSDLYTIFLERDCSLLEINPLIITPDKKIFAVDGKIEIDDNALFRQPDIMAMNDTNEKDPLEVEAMKCGLNYIRLAGNVGTMVNGAGLAMATMDLIKRTGAEPANFLDVGGSADSERIENAFRIVLANPSVKILLINIFGGILRCDILAEGVVQAARKMFRNVTIVVRMEGTNDEDGRRILENSGLRLLIAEDLKDAVRMVKGLVVI